ncbi:MAG: flagellar biosynthetic protein FlhB [Clostridiales bacterium]|jgi:flagellar biosynthetic protein FlhB|nr:flagellar biosynthetic protein FlhB [Clostridiales bacterium]
MNEKCKYDRLRKINLQLFAGSEEKTEEATPHRRQETRKKGQVAKSSDLNAAIVIMAMIIFIYWTRGYFSQNIIGFMQHILAAELTVPLSDDQLIRLYRMSVTTLFTLMGPIFIVAIVFGLAANFLQVGFLFAPEAIKPKASNLNPIEGFKKMFSKKALVEFGKALFKITIVGLVVFNLVKNRFQRLFFLPDMGVSEIASYLGKLIFQISLGAGLIFFIIAVLDFVYQKWEFRQNLKMSKYEVKQEMKQTEGDPQIKAKIKEKQRQMAQVRMMESVPEATVVVTNPTHLAVALKYEDEMEAPKVVAKGAEFIAQKIKEKAQEHDIPIIENKPVARALYDTVEIDENIPVELYQAVAEILAAVYQMDKRGK